MTDAALYAAPNGRMSPNDRRVLAALRAAIAHHGCVPPIKVVAADLGYKSHGVVLRHVDRLQLAGALTRDAHRSWRSIRLSDGETS